MMEKCNIQGTEIDLPIDLIENPDIFSHVLSLDTWNCVLTSDQRKHLKKFLPVLPTDYPHAQEENIRSLFGGENFKFGNPLQTFQKKLQAGLYTADIVNYRKRCKTAKIKEYKLRLKKFYRKLVNDVLLSRQKESSGGRQIFEICLPPEDFFWMKQTVVEIIDQVVSNARQDTPITLSWNERQFHQSSFIAGNLDTKYKKVLKEVKDECEDDCISSDEEDSDVTTKQQFVFSGNSVSQARYLSSHRGPVALTPAGLSTPGARVIVTDEDYHRMLQSHKRKRMNREAFPELDTEGITLEDIISRTNVTARRSSKTVVKRKYKVKEKREQKKRLKRKRSVPNAVPKPSPPAPPPVAAPVIPTPSEVKPPIEQSSTPDSKSYKLMERSCPCFFSLIRDIFLDLPDATAELDQLERMVGEWQQSSSCAASAWNVKERNWVDQIPSALKFLAGSRNDVPNSPRFLPMVNFKQKVHQWKWIGTCRDLDTNLVPLFEHWLETKDNVAINNTQAPTAGTVPRIEYVVAPSTVVEKSEYQNQERQRYENPHKPFIYQMHGFESIVAPVKGVFTKESNLNKAREHPLLLSKRPPYVTILTLVRDAAARLPNGEGTRAEVCLLLKDSQYVNPAAMDEQIHTVVSGALDRLHYEKDPCVKYDNARKVWIYLHKTRTIEEFEKLHEASAAAARAKKQQNQKQKLLKQQQKAKEAAIGIPESTLASIVSDDAEGSNSNLAVLSAEVPDPTKAKKPPRPKRPPSGNPKKQDKTKTKAHAESLAMSTYDVPSMVQTHLPPMNVLPPVHQVRPIAPPPPITLENLDTQDRNLLQNRQLGSNFQRTSRLNSSYIPGDQPVHETISSGCVVDMTQSGGGVDNGSDSSSSSGTVSGSESETESSGVDDRISLEGIAVPQRQDPSIQFGEQRLPFNNVMSLLQLNAEGENRDNTFGGY